MKNKISRREKVMIGILCIAAIITAYYNLIYSPQKQKIDTLVETKIKYDEELSLISKQALNVQNMQKNTKIMNSNILGLSEDLLPPVVQEKIILIMDNLIKKSEVSTGGFTMTNYVLESAEAVANDALEKQKSSLDVIVDEYDALKSAEAKTSKADATNNSTATKDKVATDDSKAKTTAENKEAEKKLPTTVEKVSISMGYQGTYDELNAFIKAVEDFPEKIIVNNLTIFTRETNITGNITLDFYFIPKINEVEEYMPWLYNGRYGKDNPFKSIGGVGNNSNSNLSVVAPKKYDFNMMVKPTSSDLPTVILGKSEDSNRSTYVYGDNDGIEEVKIEFVEKSGKYFFKYKTLNNIYPKSNNIGQEFSPKGDSINLIIYSTKRNSEEDTSGMDLKISNGTSKKVFVKILSDDKSRPRVNVITEKGEIKQER